MAEKFNVDYNPGLSDDDKAVYEAFRAVIEDRLIPMLALERFFWLKVSKRYKDLKDNPYAIIKFLNNANY